MDLLIVEDEPKTARALRDGLRVEGFSSHTAASGSEAANLLQENRYRLLILDWMLPDGDGLLVLKTVKAERAETKVIFLTARDTVEDRVQGLEAGADDYLVKPFAFAELLARIRALLRRDNGSSYPGLESRYEGIVLDIRSRRAWRDGEEAILTPREFDLLAYLVERPQQSIARSMLARDVWRETNRFTALDNVIDVHINHLRKKIDLPGRPKLIHTIRGVGYILRKEQP